ncbi:ferritin family protein [Magnetococcales bacterium HHB-1]
MDTFEAIINFAIRHEENENQFYRNLAEKAESKDLKKHLLEHAAQELEHKKHLEKILKQHRLPNGQYRYPDPDLKIANYTLAVDPPTETIGYQDALILAAKQEQEAERLYRDLAKTAQDKELKETFIFLAEQEAKHRHQLETEYDDEILTEG